MPLSESRPGQGAASLTGSVGIIPTRSGVPPLAQTTLPNMPFPLLRRIQAGALVGFFLVGAAFLLIQAGRHPRFHFQGLLRIHARYSRRARSTTQGGFCQKALPQPVTRPSPLSNTRLTDYHLDGACTHQQSAPLERIVQSGLTCRSSQVSA